VIGPGGKRPYTFKSYLNGSHRELQVHAFLKHYGAVPAATIRFTDPTIDRHGILTLDLNKVEELIGSSRKKVGESEEMIGIGS